MRRGFTLEEGEKYTIPAYPPPSNPSRFLFSSRLLRAQKCQKQKDPHSNFSLSLLCKSQKGPFLLLSLLLQAPVRGTHSLGGKEVFSEDDFSPGGNLANTEKSRFRRREGEDEGRKLRGKEEKTLFQRDT